MSYIATHRTTLGPRGRSMGDISTDDAIKVVGSETTTPGKYLGTGGLSLSTLMIWGGLGYFAYTYYNKADKTGYTRKERRAFKKVRGALRRTS